MALLGTREYPIEYEDSSLGPSARSLIEPHVETVLTWADSAAVREAVRRANDQELGAERLAALDEAWTGGELGREKIEEYTRSRCADTLRRLMKEAGSFVEAFAVDDEGALVCATGMTSDFFLGDEPKWKRAYRSGEGGVYVSEPTFDRSARELLVQISVPVTDDDGAVLGTLTAGRIVRSR